MKNTYSLERRSDGHIWVNIQPLMADIQKNYDSLCEMDTKNFTPNDLDVLELKKLGMHSVYQFLGALAMEHKLKEEAEKLALEKAITEQVNSGAELAKKALH